MKQTDVIRDYFNANNNAYTSFYDEAIASEHTRCADKLVELLSPFLENLPRKERIKIEDEINSILIHSLDETFRYGIDGLSVFLGMEQPYETFESDQIKPHYY